VRAISLSQQKIHALNKLFYLYPVAQESNSEVGVAIGGTYKNAKTGKNRKRNPRF